MSGTARSVIVYIVDDDVAVREGFAKLFRSAGLDPRPYGSAERFLGEVVDAEDACILLDITMPRMTILFQKQPPVLVADEKAGSDGDQKEICQIISFARKNCLC